jgi:DHA1 family multidrug/chloramphenicol efflux transport protein-like MFS transporter
MSNKRTFHLFAAFFVLYELTNYLSNDMIMPSMPQIVRQFHAPLTDVALSLIYFIIGGSVLQIFLAPLADYIGKRKVLLFGNLLFLVATAVIPFSHSINEFLAARFFQGMGMCFIFIGYAMIHELFDDVAAVKITSILSNISVFAPLTGPLVGTAIVSVSRWEFVFIVSGVLGTISFFGLYKNMPPGKKHTDKIDIAQITKSYKKILTHRAFVTGIMAFALSMIPFISWIGTSPAIIMENQHQPLKVYAVYQCIIFGGYAISNIMVNIMAGRIGFYKLITYGSRISLTGLICGGVLCMFSTKFVILGMMIYALGVGLYTGSLIRIALSSTGESMNLSAASMTLVMCTIMFLGLETCNRLLHFFNYSINAFAIINLVIAIPVFLLVRHFAKLNKDRQWN